LFAFVVLVATAPAVDKSETPAPTLRWAEGQPGCTFSSDSDGKYRYGLWTEDFGITLAVDSQELEKSHRRTEPIFALLVTIRYRGKDSLPVEPGQANLEFVKHYHDAHEALDPDALSAKLQDDIDALARETEKKAHKHPEKKEEAEAEFRAEQKNIAEMIEFLGSRSLRSATLGSGNPEISGWLFFPSKSKWINDWKKQEEFVLRFPLAGRTVEFPFELPPSQGEFLLRERPEK
jgi:hypothetical protein